MVIGAGQGAPGFGELHGRRTVAQFRARLPATWRIQRGNGAIGRAISGDLTDGELVVISNCEVSGRLVLDQKDECDE